MSNDFANALQKLCPDLFVPPVIRESFVVAWERVEPAARAGVVEKAGEVTGSSERFCRLMELLFREVLD